MKTPLATLLWECWRSERGSLMGRFAFVFSLAGLLAFLASITDPTDGRIFSELAKTVLWVGAIAAAFSTKLGNDGPGFPLTLCFIRPVSTRLIVVTSLLYFGLSRMLLFAVPVIILGQAFGQEFHLVPASAFIFTLALTLAASNWWTSNKVYRVVGDLLIICSLLGLFVLAIINTAEGQGLAYWLAPEQADIFYGIQLIICIAAFAVSLVGIERQRHGGDVFAHSYFSFSWQEFIRLQWGFLLAKPCPNHSALAAEIWREMKVNGVPTLAVGFLLALTIPLQHEFIVYVSSIKQDPRPTLGSMTVLVLINPLFIPLFVATRNLLDIRRVRGVLGSNLFDAVRPVTVTRLLSIKLGVLFSSLLCAWLVVYASYWLTIFVTGNEATKVVHTVVQEYFAQNDWFTIIVQGFVYFIQFATLALGFAAAQVYLVLNAKTMAIIFFGGLAVILYGAVGASWGDKTEIPILMISFSALVIALFAVTVNIWRILQRDHILKMKQTLVIVVLWLIFVASYFYLLNSNANSGDQWGMAFILWKVIIALLPLLVFGITIRSMALFRHRS